MSDESTGGAERFYATCPHCETLAYPTPEMAREKEKLHRAFCVTAGGCASTVHPARIERFQR